MPTYDFRCPAGHDFERFFGRISSAPSEVECPTCGATATRRISGGAVFLLPGEAEHDFLDGRPFGIQARTAVELRPRPRGIAGVEARHRFFFWLFCFTIS